MEKNRAENIEAIRAACIKANPEKFDMRGLADSERVWEEAVRPIRLSDVLLAVEYKYEEICNVWNLRTDDLEQQSDSTIQFIASLITQSTQ